MYLSDIRSDKLRIRQARQMPGAKILRGRDGRIYLRTKREIYVWQDTPGGLHGVDGLFKKLKKIRKKLHKPLRKIVSKAVRIHKKVTKPVRKVVTPLLAKLAPLAPVLAFIPVVGWAVAAGVTVAKLVEARKQAKTAAEAERLDAQIEEARLDAEQKKQDAIAAGYEKEYQAELAKQQLLATNPAAYNPAMFPSAPSSGGGYGPSGSSVPVAPAQSEPFDEPAPAPAGDLSKLIGPAILIGLAVMGGK